MMSPSTATSATRTSLKSNLLTAPTPSVEGESVDITVSLNKPATETVTVDYRSAESSACPTETSRPWPATLISTPDETEATFTSDPRQQQNEGDCR